MSRARPFSGSLLLLVAACCACTPATRSQPNIVMIMLDTVRADRLGCDEAARVRTPRIAELCERGVWFERVSSTSSWTLPSHASVFTGLYPIAHGATQEHTQLDEAAPTLAGLLGDAGYRTYAVSANPVVSIKSGLARGFDSFDESWRAPPRSRANGPGEHPNLVAVDRLLADRDRTRPLFLFVNFIEAHGPNDPPEPWRSAALGGRGDPRRVADVKAHTAASYYLDPESVSEGDFALLSELYDGEIAQLDALVGALLDRLEADGVLANSFVIITSDHGENFGEHGHFRHVFSLYRDTVDVPLLIVPLGDTHAGARRSDPVALLDLFSTVLGAAGVAPPPAGVDARDLFAETPRDEGRPVVAEYYYPAQALTLFAPDAPDVHRDRLGPHLRRLRSIESEGLRLIWSSDGAHELYEVAADPGEQRNLAGDPRYAERERALLAELAAFVAKNGGPRPLPGSARQNATPQGAFGDLDPESAELLRELGYLPR
jgi:arylsulfatase A-like enzyme